LIKFELLESPNHRRRHLGLTATRSRPGETGSFVVRTQRAIFIWEILKSRSCGLSYYCQRVLCNISSCLS